MLGGSTAGAPLSERNASVNTAHSPESDQFTVASACESVSSLSYRPTNPSAVSATPSDKQPDPLPGGADGSGADDPVVGGIEVEVVGEGRVVDVVGSLSADVQAPSQSRQQMAAVRPRIERGYRSGPRTPRGVRSADGRPPYRWGVEPFRSTAEIEGTFARIAAGSRIVAAIWLAILAAVTLARGAADRPSVVVAAMVVVLLWAVFGTVVAFPEHALSEGMLVVDLVVGAGVLLAPNAAGTEASFYGGLPLIVVALAALRGRASGLLAAGTLIAATLYALQALRFPAIVGETTLIFAYVGVGILVAWIGDVLRAAEAELVKANEAVVSANTAAARAAERADIGRHLHDSVLQTLALIQRDSRDPQKVTIQARRQERELRDWLFGQHETSKSGLDDGLRAAAAAVEERFEVSVDVVVVGDAPHSAAVEELVAAAGEAMANAARHAGVTDIDVYGETADGVARVYVRDRGVGFDLSEVASDRHGVRSSIVARVERLGGEAALKSSDGTGTEWKLTIPI